MVMSSKQRTISLYHFIFSFRSFFVLGFVVSHIQKSSHKVNMCMVKRDFLARGVGVWRRGEGVNSK